MPRTARPPASPATSLFRSLRRADALVPAALVAVGAGELFLLAPERWGLGLAVEIVACLLLVWRRLLPLVVCPLASAVLLLMPWVGPQLDDVAAPVLVLFLIGYTLGRWVEDLRGLVGIGLLMALFLVDYLFVDARTHDVTDVVFVTSLVVPPYVFGRISRRLAVQSELLLGQQETVRQEAVRAERDRIARDLHDVIAHSVSAMVVQTAAAQDLVRSDPERVSGLLADVADTGRRALSETGRLLHVLRDQDDELGLSPAPGLAQVPALVEEFRGRGLAVDAELPHPLPPLPAGVDVSAYRIAQEVLTNALRYAPDRATRLSVSSTPRELRIRSTNTAATEGPAGQGSGLGLLGITERVKVLGGSLRHGTREGVFELEAVVPTEGAAPS